MAVLAGGAAAQAPLPDQAGWMTRGVEALKAARYRDAADAFQNAVNLNPSDASAHLYLATACMSAYVPGNPSDENAAWASRAEDEFQRTLAITPASVVALSSLGALALQRKRFDEARDWYGKAAAAAPRDPGPYYSLGYLAWSEAYQPIQALGKPESSPAARGALKRRYGPVIEEGIRNFQRVLELDPSHDGAMAYMSLLLRLRAALRASPEESRRDLRAADDWMRGSLELKSRKKGSPSGR